jgi:uncharacterized small protein (DUF1192 family)
LETHHKHIISNGGSYEEETLRRHALAALGSGPNAKFVNSFIDSINREVHSGIGPHANIKTKQLFIACERFYNNEVSEDTWTAVDPKDARIMALADEIEQLKSTQQKSSSNKAALVTGMSNDTGNDTDLFFGVQKWRTVNRGASITRDGITYNCGVPITSTRLVITVVSTTKTTVPPLMMNGRRISAGRRRIVRRLQLPQMEEKRRSSPLLTS